MGVLNIAFSAVADNAIHESKLSSHLVDCGHVLPVLLNTEVIMYAQDISAPLHCLVHLHLVDIL